MRSCQLCVIQPALVFTAHSFNHRPSLSKRGLQLLYQTRSIRKLVLGRLQLCGRLRGPVGCVCCGR